MSMCRHALVLCLPLAGVLAGCQKTEAPAAPAAETSAAPAPATVKTAPSYASQHLADYAQVRLTADLSGLDANQKQMLVKLMEAGHFI